MSIQKITGLTQQKRILKQNHSASNTFLKGISFKGYSTQVSNKNGSAPWDEKVSYGTSGSLRHHSGEYATISKTDIEHTPNTTISQGRKGYDYQGYDKATASVYYADPGEKITDRVLDSNMYIVEYPKMPDIVSKEDIEASSKSSELKAYIEILEERSKYLDTQKKQTAQEFQEVQNALNIAKEALNKAKRNYDVKLQEKTTKQTEAKENSDRLKLAKTRYEEAKNSEKKAYKSLQTKNALKKMQQKLNELNDEGDEGLSAIIEKIQAYLGEDIK